VAKVTIYSRRGCHLCDVAEGVVREVQSEITFELEVLFIDGDAKLEKQYGEEVPVTLIDGERHDFFRVDKERFRSALLRQHR
jgi:glutaredoxin